jgi:hypothetical protein
MVKEAQEEWFGYGFISDDSEPEKIENQFIENIRFAEYWCRRLGMEKRGWPLAARLSALFDELPDGCERVITDDRAALIREIVNARNRFAHGKYDAPRLPHARLLVLLIKLAALLLFSDALHEKGASIAVELSQQSSPYLRKMLGQSDKLPDSP